MKPCKFRVMDKCKCEESSQLFCFGECACFKPREIESEKMRELKSNLKMTEEGRRFLEIAEEVQNGE